MQLIKFKSVLEAEKAIIIQAQLIAKNKELDAQGDEIDKIQADIIARADAQLVARNQIKLLRIDNALKRIEEGNYGICGECEEEIGIKRLTFNATINTCISCAEKNELNRKRMG
jgi:RNA polymerase-binding transcription factor